MAKNRNKGFTLLEVLIVSTVILSTLIFMYIQFVNINNTYNVAFTHNTVPGLYIAKEISEYMKDTNYIAVTDQIENGYLDISTNYNYSGALYNDLIKKANASKIFLTKEDPIDFQNYIEEKYKSDKEWLTRNGIDNSFIKFILGIENENKIDGYRLIIKYNDNTFATIVLSSKNIATS